MPCTDTIMPDANTRILVTGAAGFIGFHLSRRLLERGCQVVGLDDLNDYYDAELKQSRLEILLQQPGFRFVRAALEDNAAMARLFADQSFHTVVNLAAQAGVRYSLTNPHAYIASNINGFLNMLEGCRQQGVRHLIYASSSSVYGANSKAPFHEDDPTDHPVSLYAATKKSNELMAHSYAHLYGLPCTGLRFFTVYGPWGRPDMAYFKFTKAILAGTPIDVYNNGNMMRDFTYIDDIVEGIIRIMPITPVADPAYNTATPAPSGSSVPHRIYNIGNNTPAPLGTLIKLLEKLLGRQANKNLLPMQPGDVPSTYADISRLQHATGFAPSTPLESGLARFVEWYRGYYR